ncbi:MAG: NTP transferase domain-containing protein [Bacteroidia bacterium]|nr:NTP transferase domain-containing protein [Bacteroidia bacterium]
MKALVLAGGSGTRFWPVSRRQRPKQLLSLEGGPSLLQATVERLQPLIEPSSVWVCTTEILTQQVREQLPLVPEDQILAEPAGRNTALAIGWSLQSMPAGERDEVVVVLPADHRIEDRDAFRRTLETAEKITREDNRVMTLGVEPVRPDTGYGYLELGALLEPESGLRRVVRYKEKPDQATANRFVESGNYLWNAGIFLFRVGRLLELLEAHQPEIARGLAAIERQPHRIGELYPQLPSISIDHGVMEHLDEVVTLPLDCGWSDLGSWEALADFMSLDERGNVSKGEVISVDCQDNLFYAEEGTIAALGIEGLVVVKTRDSVLVVPKNRTQEIRKIVAALEDRGLKRLL